MSEFQDRLMSVLDASLNKQASTTDLAHRLKTSRLAVVSGMRALERAGRVVAFRSGRDQWAALTWGGAQWMTSSALGSCWRT